MKRFPLITVVAIALFVAVSASATDDWTLMVYLDADSNLHNAGLDDMSEMASCSNNSAVNIIVLFDGKYAPYDESYLYKIEYNNRYELVDGGAVIPPSGECDMSDYNQLDKFVDWAQANYPADKYLLSIWNHGDGIFRGQSDIPMFKGVCGGMQLWEIDGVLETTVDPVDIVGFDVCLLGQIETGWQLSENVDYVIASEETEPFDGWEYTAFDLVCDNSSALPTDLIEEIINDYFDYSYGADTQAGQDLTVLRGNLSTDLSAFCTELIVACGSYKSDITSARSSAWNSSYNTDCKDLYEFAEAISNDNDLPTSLRDSASDFCTEWENYIVAGGLHHPDDSASGATVYFPTNAPNSSDWNTYMSNITFTATMWDEFLLEYANPTGIKSASLGEIKATYK
jgi:hypothetical protein